MAWTNCNAASRRSFGAVRRSGLAGAIDHRGWPGVRLRPLVMAAAAVAVAAGYGVTDEFHQALVPGRTASVTDWGIDVVGATAAAGIGYCILLWHGNRQVSRAT